MLRQLGDGLARRVGTIQKIKFADKLRALELLGKYLKLFTEKVELDGSVKYEGWTLEQIDARIEELLAETKRGPFGGGS